ncbi:MAG: hypothetical protein QME73_03090 [Bacillota bacterium]|nr:hypothetical protein [Bacillota bacterium]
MSKSTKPTTKEWLALYEASVTFKKSACWEWMYDDDIFGIQDPETGEISFCCIMGNAGEHFAVAGYLGNEGLDGILKMLSGELEPDDPDNMFVQKCLMCSFEDRTLLAPEDLRVIKKLGLKFRGKNAWPVFRHYAPGLFPWFITGQQCRFLTHILNQALEVSLRCRESKDILEHKTIQTYFVRTSKKTSDGDIVWEDKYIEIEPFHPAFVSFHITDEIRVRKLASIQPDKRLALEADTFYIPNPVKEKGRPYYPKVCALLDHHSGMVLSFDMLSNLSTEGHKCIELLADFIEHTGKKPSKLFVAREETYYLFLDLCNQIDITLEMVEHLEFAEEMRFGLLNFPSFQ